MIPMRRAQRGSAKREVRTCELVVTSEMLDFSRNGGASGACPGHVFLSVHKLFLTYVSFFVVFICPVWVCVGNKLYMPQIQTLLLFFIIKEMQKRQSRSPPMSR